MQIISQFAPLPLAQPEKGTAVAMGFFDGIHIGHRAVIESAVQWAKEHDAAPAVFTFKLPVVNKMKGKRLLSTADKHALIASLGVEYYLTPDFEEIKGLTPEQFVLGIVRDCNARALVCGENFTFGAKAAGNPELLRTLCAPLGVEVIVVPMAQFEEKPVSSTSSAPRWKAATSRQQTPCWGCPTPSGSRCSTVQVWAIRWGCPPSTSCIPRAFNCPAAASISPAPTLAGCGTLRPPALAAALPSMMMPPR